MIIQLTKDTISTSGGTEDHVSMGGWSARKALKVIGNVENILAIELLAGCQALGLLYNLLRIYLFILSSRNPSEKDEVHAALFKIC